MITAVSAKLQSMKAQRATNPNHLVQISQEIARAAAQGQERVTVQMTAVSEDELNEIFNQLDYFGYHYAYYADDFNLTELQIDWSNPQ